MWALETHAHLVIMLNSNLESCWGMVDITGPYLCSQVSDICYKSEWYKKQDIRQQFQARKKYKSKWESEKVMSAIFKTKKIRSGVGELKNRKD